MAKDKTNTGPVPTLTPSVSPASSVGKGPSDFDRFVASNLDKAVIGTPTDDGGIAPVSATASGTAPTPAAVVELPAGIPAEARAMIEATIAARQPHAVAAPPATPTPGTSPTAPPQMPQAQQFAVDRGAPRAWSPTDVLVPTTPQRVLEEAMYRNQSTPIGVQSGTGGFVKEVQPKADTPQVYVEAYNLFASIIAGNWVVYGPKRSEIESLLPRLKLEIEEAPNAVKAKKVEG